MNVFDLSVYLNCLKSIKCELETNSADTPCLSLALNNLENYLEQIKSIEHSVIFQQDNQSATTSKSLYSKQELKIKLLFKLNNCLNEEFETINLKL